MLPITGILMFAQDQDLSAASVQDVHLIMIFVGIIALVLVLVLLGVLIAGLFALKFVNRISKLVDELKGKAMSVVDKTTPIIDKANGIVADLTPKIKSVGADVERISHTVTAKVEEVGQTVSQINQTVQDVNGRTRTQVGKVDGIVSEALDTTAHVSHTVQEGIRAPIRQISGIVTGIKVGIETFLKRAGYRRPPVQAPVEPVTGAPVRPGPYDI